MSRSKAEEEFQSELRHHRREWLVERIGWFVLLGFIIVAMCGYFGHGPVSEATISAANGATLRYERFARYASSTLIEIELAHAPHEVVVEINDAYLKDFEITSLTPQPRSNELVEGRHRFTFAFEQGPGTIYLRAEPEKAGSKHGIVVVAGTEFAFRQFIYP